MSWAGRIDGYWRNSVPASRLAAVRVLVGAFALVYLSIRIPHIWSYTNFRDHQFAPVGVLSFLDGPPPSWSVALVLAATWLTGMCFVTGWRFRSTAPVFALGLLVTLSYSSSWRQIFHTENLLVFYVGILALSRSADAYSLDRRGRSDESEHGRYGWPLRLMCVVAVATYFLAGVAKLRWGGADWAGGDVLRDTIAADSLRKIVLGSSHSPIAEVVLGQGWLFVALAWLTLVVEVGAPLALLHRRVAAVWVLGVIGFHLGVLALMAIMFPFPISGIAFAPFFRAERFVDRLHGWGQRRMGRRRPVAAD